MRALKYYFNKFLDYCFFGKITTKVKVRDGGCDSEIEYYGRGGRVVGYLAYGSWDPAYPYPRGLKIRKK